MLKNYKNLLKTLVNQNSWSLNLDGVNLVQDILRGELETLAFRTEAIEIPERGYLLSATTHAYQPNQPYILVLGHADTVHKPDSDFKEFSESGERWYGPGIFDMKAGLIMALISFAQLNDLGLLHTIPLKFISNSAEEIGSQMARSILAQLVEHACAGLVLEFGRPNNAVILERAGFLAGRITINGRAAHSGNARAEGASAITELARAIRFINSLTAEARGTLTNVGVVEGGIANNIMAPTASLTFEARFTCSAELERIRSALKNYPAAHDNRISVAVNEYSSLEPMIKHPNTLLLFEHYHQAAKRIQQTLTIHPQVNGISDGNVLTKVGVPVLDALGPDGNGAHTDHEYVIASSINKRAEILTEFLKGAERYVEEATPSPDISYHSYYGER